MQSETIRALNQGTTVQLKTLGDVVVKEPTLEGVVRVSSDLLTLLNVFTTNGAVDPTADGMSFIAKIAKAPQTLVAFKAVLSEVTDKTVNEFDELPVSDLLILLTAAKEVVDWEELYKLFMQLMPKGTMTKLKAAVAIGS